MAPPTARFKVDRRGIGDLLRSPMMQAEMARRAGMVAGVAEIIAPISPRLDDPHPGLYKSSFTVSVRERGAHRRDRAEAKVTNTVWYAAHVEYGAEGGRGGAHHVLLRAAMAAGG